MCVCVCVRARARVFICIMLISCKAQSNKNNLNLCSCLHLWLGWVRWFILLLSEYINHVSLTVARLGQVVYIAVV